MKIFILALAACLAATPAIANERALSDADTTRSETIIVTGMPTAKQVAAVASPNAEIFKPGSGRAVFGGVRVSW